MRNFLVTFFAFLVALIPLFAFTFFYFFLETATEFFGLPTIFPYFLFGIFVGTFWSDMKSMYREWWMLIWESAESRL